MTKTPKVSVIIPCYNVAPWLERCLDSLINQTLSDLEIICIDDKSTDETLKILNKYDKKDDRVKLCQLKENSGVAVARNKGMEIATGEYIGFVDPDDFVDLDFYEKLYNTAHKNNADIVKAGVKIIDIPHKTESTISSVGMPIHEFCSQFWSAIYKHTFLIKNKITFPDGIITAQDSTFLTQVSLNTNSFICIDENTYYHYFYQRPNSLDSEMLTHAKAMSKYNAFKLNLEYINQSQHIDKNKFIMSHVVGHLSYELSKQFELSSDKKILFNFFINVLKEYNLLNSIKYFGRRKLHAIKHNNYDAFVFQCDKIKKKLYLFGVLPLLSIEYVDTRCQIYLFDVILLIKIKRC